MTTREHQGTNICITGALANVVGQVARQHPDCSIQIQWTEGTAEQEWLISAMDGQHEHHYLADDEAGIYVEAGNDLLVDLIDCGADIIDRRN